MIEALEKGVSFDTERGIPTLSPRYNTNLKNVYKCLKALPHATINWAIFLGDFGLLGALQTILDHCRSAFQR